MIVQVPRIPAATHAERARSLFPPGKYWIRGAPRFDGLCLALGDEIARVQAREVDAVDEADVRTTIDLIGDWERVLGLPDACDTTPPTVLADRRAALHAKLIAQGGQAPAYFVAVALAFGLAVTIVEFPNGHVFRVGASRVGDRLNDLSAEFQWRVDASILTSAALRTRLECTIRALAPSHTVVSFLYA